MAIIRVPLVIRNGRVEELPPNEKIKNCTETLKFSFPTPGVEWLIVHSLDKFPTVSAVDNGGNLIQGAVDYIDSNTIRIRFSKPVSGTAYIN